KGTLLEMGGDADPQILFAGSSSPVASTVTSGVLPFSGPLRGCIQFAIFLQRLSLNDRLNWGFQFLIPDGGGGLFPTRSEYLPLANGFQPNATDMIGFKVSIDASDVYNKAFDPCEASGTCDIQKAYDSRRTYFNFTGVNRDDSETVLASFYRTI